MCSEIHLTEIQILPVKPRDGLVAIVSFVLNNKFYIGGVAIHAKPDGSGYRLLYPTKILPNGKHISLFHPIEKGAGEAIRAAVSDSYKRLLENI